MLRSDDGFEQRSLVYNAGPARPGLAASLAQQLGVKEYPETPFNVFRFEVLSLRQLVLSTDAPIQPWLGCTSTQRLYRPCLDLILTTMLWPQIVGSVSYAPASGS